MGKRSRQREAPGAKRPQKLSVRERADAANRVAEKRIKERPPAPWDPFPLTELAILSGIVLMVIGIFLHGSAGKGVLAAGVVLACIGGLETALREHFGGYRAHSGLLAGIATLASLFFTTSVLGAGVVVRAAVAIAVFGLLFPALRRAFIRKSGGSGVL